MRTMVLAAALAVAVVGAGVAPALADRTEDDLAAVRKAVGSAPPAEAAPGASAARPRSASEAKWFRVRVVEKGAKHGRVSINLPLALVRAVGEDWPVHGCRRCEGRLGPTIGELLRSLDSGQSLVEIEDEDATVRVWVE